MRSNKYEYDAFISHAVEDKIPIANELCAKLERAGLKIWYSGKELGIGDSIEKTIEKGLNRSRYGIVIFSPTYLAKNWTIREFYTLLAKEIEEQKVILPVLFNISLDELKNKDLVMADRFAVNADRGIDYVADRLVQEIRKSQPVKIKEAWFSRMWCFLVLSLLLNIAMALKGTLLSDTPPAIGSSETIRGGSQGAYPVHQRILLSEMQGLFDQLNFCTCNRREERKPKRLKETRLVRNAGYPGEGEFYKDQESAESGTVATTSVRKITMAVVLQIDSHPASAAPDMEKESDDLLSTISLSEENDFNVGVGGLDIARHDGKGQCANAH